MQIVTLLANLAIKPKEGSEERLRLEHKASPVKADPEVRINTGSQVNCIGEEVFKQLELPSSILTGPKETRREGNIDIKDLGKVILKACHKHHRKGGQPSWIQFHVIRGLGN